jgi:RNA polymerase sigma-70 factor, ECF subfamily
MARILPFVQRWWCEDSVRAGHFIGVEASAADRERFRLLFETHHASVLRYAQRRVVADGASDAAAEVFLVAWRRLSDVPTDPLPWLYGVARGVCANQRRSVARRMRLTERVAMASATGVGVAASNGLDVYEGDSALASAFDLLGEGDREVLALIAWEGLGARDAGHVLGCSIPAVTMRLHRARRRLRALLDQQTEEN